MNQPAKAQEPSMEEILASIRRIIADDDTGKPPPKAVDRCRRRRWPCGRNRRHRRRAAPAAAAATGARAGDAAGRHRRDAVEPQRGGRAAAVEEPPPAPDILDLTESMATAEPEPAERRLPHHRRPVRRGVRRAAVRAGAARRRRGAAPHARTPTRCSRPRPPSAVDSAFNTLAQTVLVQNARTLEDLVREMLRPMLKTWLDDNLPGLVERLVRAEIERVSRGRRLGVVSDQNWPASRSCSTRVQLAREPQRQRRQRQPGHDEQRHRAGAVEHERAQRRRRRSARDRSPRRTARTPVPRASGVICVPQVCSVLCSA